MVFQIGALILTTITLIMCARVCLVSEDAAGTFDLIADFTALLILLDIDDFMENVLVQILQLLGL